VKIVPFPQPEGMPDERALARIEAALHGEEGGGEVVAVTAAERADAAYWRQLRGDVRALAPPMSEEFALRLYEAVAAREAAPARRFPPRFGFGRALARMRAWLGSGMHARLVAAGGISAMAAIVTLVVVAPWHETEMLSAKMFSPHSSVEVKSALDSSSGTGRAAPKEGPVTPYYKEASRPEAGASSGAASAAGEASPARVQQRAASLTLAPKPAAVQSVADEVAQLTAREGGFVQSSQVRRQTGAAGSAELRLSLPSARLSGALAALGRLAPVQAESQSLQDITDEYDAARRKLADAVAERQALLRALARASTQGEIESLHARIALAATAVTRARTAFGAVSRRGSNSTVEVSVYGDAHGSAAGRSTLEDGLHDALGVLKTALAVLLVALAVLVPLSLVLGTALLGWRASRRRLRERALS